MYLIFSRTSSSESSGFYVLHKSGCLGSVHHLSLLRLAEIWCCAVLFLTPVSHLRLPLFVVRPDIAQNAVLYTTVERNPINIPCQSTGNPQPEIVWRKKGQAIPLNTQVGFRVATDGSLTIENPSASEAGKYTCTAINSAGRDSIEVSLDVYRKCAYGFSAGISPL